MLSQFFGDRHCPICKRELEDGLMSGHHCSARTLAAINAANTRAENEEPAFSQDTQRPFGQRLVEGFLISNGEDP